MGRTAFIARHEILDRLLRLRDQGRLGQPFLLAGPEGSGKENTALEFARLLNCAEPETCGKPRLCESCVKALGFQHPDIRWIGPAPAAVGEDEVRRLLEAKIAQPFHQPPWTATAQISIGDPENPGPLSLRSLIQFVRRRAFQSPWKVAIVADGQRLNAAAANAFLKTLEEPPPQTVIFLLVPGTEGVLPTILSRCQKIRFEPWPDAELAALLQTLGESDPAAALQAARAADGNARRAVTLLEPAAKVLTDWAMRLYDWIQAGDRFESAVSADELHRGLISHACPLPAELTAKSLEVKDGPERRERAIRLCELLILLYSDTVACRELGADWRPRLTGAAERVAAAAAVRRSETLLGDLARIETARQEIDRNLNTGLVMAVLCEGLIDHARSDQTAVRTASR